MDASSNGHGGRPFGPHGEGCTCEPETAEETHENTTDPDDNAGPRTMVITQENSLHEIVWAAASEAIAVTMLSAIATCAADREPLSHRQQTHIFAGALRGFALSKETAAVIEATYYAQLVASQKEQEPEMKLRSVTELFNGGEELGGN